MTSIMLESLSHFAQPGALLLAVIIDAVLGDPAWIYRRMPHPVVWIGQVIGWSDQWFNRESQSPLTRKRAGIAVIFVLTLGGLLLGALLQSLLLDLPWGHFWLAIVMSSLIAQNSLYRHVAAVASGLEISGAEGGRIAVAKIVGRDPESLERAGISRAAIESLAENFSDGIVAPVFWAVLLGLPGLLAYKVINTADSMIGHRTDRHLQFGWGAARLDDVVNIIPARLSGLLLVVAAALLPDAHALKAWQAMWRDARYHRSPNAGWPEAATAGALGVALAGPRYYHGSLVMDHWMGKGGTPYASAIDIRRALHLYLLACVLQAFLLLFWYSQTA
jgi:adenosylcobinamide-phosphate synthase